MPTKPLIVVTFVTALLALAALAYAQGTHLRVAHRLRLRYGAWRLLRLK